MVEFNNLRNFIEKHDVITIFSHIFPDGDAIGSLIGMRELIKTNYPNKEVYALGSNVSPYSDVAGNTDFVSDEVIKKSAALIVDIANSERVEDQRFKLAKSSFKIDHHIFVEKFTTDEIVMNNRIATCEIIAEFLLDQNLKINEKGATALLLGIITDSGRYFYELTSAMTFTTSAFLLKANADFAKINDHLAKRSLASLKPRGYIMYNYEIYKNIIYIFVPYKKLIELGLKASDGTNFVNIFGNISEYPLWATFFEDEDGKIFVELRSKLYNVQSIARQFGGGGHLKASGCRLSSAAAISDLLDALCKAEDI